MSTLQLVAVVGLLAWAVVKAPAIRHFVQGVRNAIAFGTQPRQFFARLRKDGSAAVPFAPVLGKRTWLVVDQAAIGKVFALPTSAMGVTEGQYQQDYVRRRLRRLAHGCSTPLAPGASVRARR